MGSPNSDEGTYKCCVPRFRNKLPPGAGIDELRLRLLSIYQRLKIIEEKKIMVAEEVFVNCYNFNPVRMNESK
jgi:hypothetical protein